MATSRDRQHYGSSASNTECSSSCPSPATSISQQTGKLNNAPKYGTLVPYRIFVGGLDTNTRDVDLMYSFSAYGSVKSAKVIKDRAGVSKGYGFVTFASIEEAQRLVQQKTLLLDGRELNIGPAVKKQPFHPAFKPPQPPASPQTSYCCLPSGPNYWVANGMLCMMPPSPPLQVPVEGDRMGLNQRNDPGYQNAMVPAVASSVPHSIYPFVPQPVFFSTSSPFPQMPMAQCFEFPPGAYPSPLLAASNYEQPQPFFEVPYGTETTPQNFYQQTEAHREDVQNNTQSHSSALVRKASRFPSNWKRS